MTDWNALRDSAKEPDTLEKIVMDLSDAVLPLVSGMKRLDTPQNIDLVQNELHDLIHRLEIIRIEMEMIRIESEVQNGN